MALLRALKLSDAVCSRAITAGTTTIYNCEQSINRAERRGVNSGRVLKYLGLKLKFNGRIQRGEIDGSGFGGRRFRIVSALCCVQPWETTRISDHPRSGRRIGCSTASRRTAARLDSAGRRHAEAEW